MSDFMVLPLGVGDAFSAHYYSTCLALRSEGVWVLIDCPHPIRKILRESSAPGGFNLDVDQIDAIFLTHLHADHASGLEGFGFYSFFKTGRRARIVTHPDVAARLWDGHLSAGMETSLSTSGDTLTARTLDDYFKIIDLSLDKPIQYGPFSLECFPTRHHIPTYALRITAGDRVLGYSSDTTFYPPLIEWLSEADLIIHETNEGTHTPYQKLVTLPESLRQKMRVVHYTDDFDPHNSVIEAIFQGVPLDV